MEDAGGIVLSAEELVGPVLPAAAQVHRTLTDALWAPGAAVVGWIPWTPSPWGPPFWHT